MKEFLRSRLYSFRFAFAGWWHVIRTQRNAWIHAVVSVTVIVICLWLRLPPRDWAVIFIAIAMVWTAEFINTALEAIVDLASPQQNQLARVSKDVGAAAVLIAALASALIGLLIIGPPLWMQLSPIVGLLFP
jgi:diacylglycerol kinase (ATP)